MITVEEFVAALPYLMATEATASESSAIAADTSTIASTTWWRTETTNPWTEDDSEDGDDEQVKQAA